MKISKEITGIVLRHLGVPSFGKDKDGKFLLTEEQKNKLSGLFGQGFAREFADKIAEWDGDLNFSSLKRPAAVATIAGAAAASTSVTTNNVVSNSIAAAAAATDEKGADTPEAIAAREDATTLIMTAISGHAAETLAVELRNAQASLASEKKKARALEEVVAALSAAPEQNPSAEHAPTAVKGKEGVKAIMKIDYSNPLYAAARSFLESGNANVFAGTTIDVTDLKTEFGKYLSQNQNNLEIIKKLFTGFPSAQYFTTIPATTEYRALRSLITSVVQQFSPKWTPGGKSKFTPIKIINRRHKINVPIVPAEVLDSYMFMLYDESMSPDQMPITTYIWEQLVYPSVLQDLELRMIFKGKFVDHSGTVVEGQAATPPEDAMDGLETILVDSKAVSGQNGINFFEKFRGVDYSNFNYMSATDQQVLNFVNAYVDWFSPLYKGMIMPIFCSDDFKRRYKRAYKAVWGTGAGVSGDFGEDRIDYSNNMLVAPTGMYGSPILFSTPKQNMIKLRHKNEVPQVINDVQKIGYEVRLFGEFWMAVGFAIGEAVFAFVPDNYDPKAQITKNWGDHSEYQDWQYADGSTSGSGGI